MPIPDYQSLMLPVLVASSKGEISIGSVVEELSVQFGLSMEERQQLLPSAMGNVFGNRVGWAKTYLGKAHLVEITKRGHFRITQRGIDVLTKGPIRIDNKFLAQFEEYRQFIHKARGKDDELSREPIPEQEDQKQTPDEVMRGAHQQIEAALALELLDRIRQAPPDFFERLLVSLLLSMGFGGSVENAGRALG